MRDGGKAHPAPGRVFLELEAGFDVNGCGREVGWERHGRAWWLLWPLEWPFLSPLASGAKLASDMATHSDSTGSQVSGAAISGVDR